MKKAIVTTTINPPTHALMQFIKIARRDNWHVFIVGDRKTPHEAYWALTKINPGLITYLHPVDQHKTDAELSDLIGWNCIQRRNFGLIAAYRAGAEIIATVDDDNIPLKDWGKNLVIGKEVRIDEFDHNDPVFDPLCITRLPGTPLPGIWHRGFPVQLLPGKGGTISLNHDVLRKPLVQADLWNGDPDVDAICRIAMAPEIEFNHDTFYCGKVAGPFNSQNTFLAREVIPYYFLFPHIGRMDDIWASYILQHRFPNSVVYGPASVFQERNEHDLIKDLEAELLGYRHSLAFSQAKEPAQWRKFIPDKSLKAYDVYRELLSEPINEEA